MDIAQELLEILYKKKIISLGEKQKMWQDFKNAYSKKRINQYKR